MLMVLVHLNGSLIPGLFTPILHLFSWLLAPSVLYLLPACISPVTAQNLIIPQLPNDGISVVDAPAPNTVLHAGNNISIAIDVSAGTSGTFVFNSLEIYLVSVQANANVTVSAGPQFLTQEPGSTVKHLDWPVPACMPTAEYNLTVYEASALNGVGYFAIMPLTVQLENNGLPDGSCSSGVNDLQPQPQPSSPPPVGLIPGRAKPSDSDTSIPSATDSSTGTTTAAVPPNDTLTSMSAQQTGGGIITVTAGDGEITIPLSDLPGTIVVEPSGGTPLDPGPTGSSGFTTIFKTVAPTATLTEVITQPITITFEETFVSTSTAPGQTVEFTVTQTLLSTIQVVQTQVSSPQQAGLLPVNSALHSFPVGFANIPWMLCGLYFLLRILLLI